MTERRGICVQTHYGLIRAICLKYFGKAADTASIEADDLVNQVALAIEVRNRGKCPYRPKTGYGPKPYIYRVAWQTLGRMARKRRRWYNIALHDDHGMLCQLAAAQGYAEIGGEHPLGRLADEAKAERKRAAAARKAAKEGESMRRIKARAGTVLISMLSQDTSEDGKNVIDPETGLYLGREVHQPIGVVVASGVASIEVGQKVVTVCDLGEQYTYSGMTLQLGKVAESCKCGRPINTSRDVAAVQVGGKWTAAPGRVLAKLVQREQHSDAVGAIAVDDGVECGIDCDNERIVYFKRGDGIRWTQEGVSYVSLAESARCACGRKPTNELLAQDAQTGGKKAAQPTKKPKVGAGKKPRKRAVKAKKTPREAK